MEKVNIESLIDKYNPWRRGEGMVYLKPPAYRRAIFNDVWDIVEKKRQIPILSGPFGVGKTTILLQLIEKLLSSGVPPQNILYLSLNDPALWGADYDAIPGELLSRFGDNPDGCYLFLDDCHRYPAAYEHLAALSSNCDGVRIIAASEPMADTGAKRRATGRFTEIKIAPFSFSDYFFCDLSLREGFDKAEIIRAGYQNIKADFYKLFTRQFSEHIDGLPIIPLIEKGVSELLSLLNERLPVNIPIEDDYSERMLLSYLTAGGLPGMWGISDPPAAGEYIVRNYIERVVLQNVGEFHKGVLEKLPRLIYSIFTAAGGETNLQRIAKGVGSETEDVKRALSDLEAAGLISTVRRYGATTRKVSDNFILYPFDIAAHSALAYRPERHIPTQRAQFNLVYNLLCSWDSVLTVSYYRGDDGEIPGFIVTLDSGRELPVFLNVGLDETPNKSLSGFIRTGKIPYGIMITDKGNARFKDRILYVSLNYFLLFFKDI